MSEPIRLGTRLDRLWREFMAERRKAWDGDRDAANRAGRLLARYLQEFQAPKDRWPRDKAGRLLTPREVIAQEGEAS